MRPIPVGISHAVETVVAERFTVPGLMPEIPSWAGMPEVLATAMVVAIMEWAALETILPYLDDGEHSLGVRVDMTHTAPTGRGLPVRARATVTAVDASGVDFEIVASDATGVIGRALHRRAVVDGARFERRVAAAREAFRHEGAR
ncbi:MAG: thioesterase family protein [Vulcanimicrobiaceae bacterium]